MHLLVLALWALVLMVVIALAGAAIGVYAGEASDSRSAFLLWNAFSQLMTFALPVLLMSWMYYRGEQRAFYKLDFGRRKWLLSLAGIGVLLLLLPLTDWLAVWNDGWHLPGEESLRSIGEKSQRLVEGLLRECHPLLSLFGLALIPALCEELFFRAGMQNLLQRWFKNGHAAVWVTAAIFSLAHGEVFAFMPRLALGILLGYLYLYGRSLLVNVMAHFVNNALVVTAYALHAGGVLEQDPSEPLGVDPVLVIVCTLAAAALFYVAFLRHQTKEVTKS